MIVKTGGSLLIKREAAFSEDERFRYYLKILWDPGEPLLVVIGLNPSTADHNRDDPTLRRCVGFARAFGRGGLLMLNAYAYRATKPSDLRSEGYPVGAENTLENLRMWKRSACAELPAIAAWGTNCPLGREIDICGALAPIQCFRRTPSGRPEHPLYLPADTIPVNFEPQGSAPPPKARKERTFSDFAGGEGMILDPAEAPPKRGNRKNTRRWCKGVEGREHQWETVPLYVTGRDGRPSPVGCRLSAKWYVLDRCMNCGKQARCRLDDSGGTQ